MASSSTVDKFLQQTRRYAQDAYYGIRDDANQTFSLGDYNATFEASPEAGGDIIRWTYDIEQHWLEKFLDELRPDDVLFDVGANLGFYTCFSMNVIDEGEIVAFEPVPGNVRQLRENLNRNEGQAEVRSVALSDEEGSVRFTEQDTEVGFATGTISPNGTADGEEVPTLPGDRLVESGELEQPTVVKIDVEGSEPLVLDGLSSTLSDPACRAVFCEIHLPKEDGSRPSVRDFGSDASDIKSTLRDLGFELTDVDRRNQELHVQAKRP